MIPCECPSIFGEEASWKEYSPALKYQTTAAIALSGCTIFANVISIVHASQWDVGSTRLDKIHNVAIHLQGIILAVLALFCEIEFVQLLRVASTFRSLSSRVLLWSLLAAVTYTSNKDFPYYTYISFIALSCLVNAGFYFLAAIYQMLVNRMPSGSL